MSACFLGLQFFFTVMLYFLLLFNVSDKMKRSSSFCYSLATNCGGALVDFGRFFGETQPDGLNVKSESLDSTFVCAFDVF